MTCGQHHCESPIGAAQFIRGVAEPTVPDVNLTRAKDGSSGTATFVFAEPSVFEASEDLGEITGLYMVDAEGTLETVDVQVRAPLCPVVFVENDAVLVPGACIIQCGDMGSNVTRVEPAESVAAAACNG